MGLFSLRPWPLWKGVRCLVSPSQSELYQAPGRCHHLGAARPRRRQAPAQSHPASEDRLLSPAWPLPTLTACYPGQTRGKTGNLKTKEEASQRCRVGVAERSPPGGPCRGSMLPGPPFSRTLYQLPRSLRFLSQPQPGPCRQPAAALAVAPSHSLPALVSTPGNRDCLHFTGRKAE